MFIFAPNYFYKNCSVTLNGREHSVGYKMSWFKRDDDESGISVDWDSYDRVNNTNYMSEDRGTIEVPANSDTVIYESPDGETYEIPLSDLIDADDDNEIEYKSKECAFLKRNSIILPQASSNKIKYDNLCNAGLSRSRAFARTR